MGWTASVRQGVAVDAREVVYHGSGGPGSEVVGRVVRWAGRSVPAYAECNGQRGRFHALVELGDIEAADAALAAAHAAVRTIWSQWTVGFLDATRARRRAIDRAESAEHECARPRARRAPLALAESAFVRMVSCIRLIQGRLREHEPARSAMARDVTNLPPTFFVARAHAARERRPRAACEAFSARWRGPAQDAARSDMTTTLTWAATSPLVDDRSTAKRLLSS